MDRAICKEWLGPDLLIDATFLAPSAMIFRRGNLCDGTVLKGYALMNRQRTLCRNLLAQIAAERKKTELAREGCLRAESRMPSEAWLHAEAQATLKTELRIAVEAQHSAQAMAASQLRQSAIARSNGHTPEDGYPQDRLQAQVDEDTIATLTQATMRYGRELKELRSLVRDMQRSHSWRLTKPIRIAGIVLRSIPKRLRRPIARLR